MIDGMTTKIAVSLPDEQVAAARAAVAEGRAASVSAYVAEALSRRSIEDELLHLLEQDEAAGEPTTDEHRAWARQALGSAEQPATVEPEGTARRPKTRTGKSTRTAASGRYVSKATSARHPSTSVSEPGRTATSRG